MNRTTGGTLLFTARVALVAAMLAGCRTYSGEKYMRQVATAEQLRTIEPFGAAQAAPPVEAPAPVAPAEPSAPAEITMSLQDCRAAALENNLELKVVLINPAIASESVNQEQARFEASLFSNLDFARTDTPVSSALDASKAEAVTGNLGVSFPLRTGGTITLDLPANRFKDDNAFSTLNPAYTSDLRASITQPLLRGAGVKANTHAIRVARYQSQISDARTKLEVMRIVAAVDRVYWRLYAARKQLGVRKNEYGLAVAQLDRAKRRVEVGLAREIDVVSAEVGVAERLEAVIIAGNDLRLRERDLKRSLNRPGLALDSPAAVAPSDEPDTVHYAFDAAGLVTGAIRNRMELVELELQIAQDSSAVDYAGNQKLPALALGYSYNVNGLGGTVGDSFDVMTDKNFEDHRVGLELTVPLGNAAARSRLRQAVAARVQRLATRESRRAEITQEVLSTLDQLEANWQRVLANRQRSILAARNLDAEIRQFELGLRTSTDVLDAQTRLANAQSAEINSLVEYQIAQVDLAYATGTLLGAARITWEPSPIPK